MDESRGSGAQGAYGRGRDDVLRFSIGVIHDAEVEAGEDRELMQQPWKVGLPGDRREFGGRHGRKNHVARVQRAQALEHDVWVRRDITNLVQGECAQDSVHVQVKDPSLVYHVQGRCIRLRRGKRACFHVPLRMQGNCAGGCPGLTSCLPQRRPRRPVQPIPEPMPRGASCTGSAPQ